MTDLPFLIGLTLLVTVMQRGSRLVRAEGAILVAVCDEKPARNTTNVNACRRVGGDRMEAEPKP